MKPAMKILGGAVMGASLLAFSIGSASAAIVCNDDACWHVKERYSYPPDARLSIHPDDWKWGPSDKYKWREHEGRGYWRGDTWEEF
jgi:hypothetical protein